MNDLVRKLIQNERVRDAVYVFNTIRQAENFSCPSFYLDLFAEQGFHYLFALTKYEPLVDAFKEIIKHDTEMLEAFEKEIENKEVNRTVKFYKMHIRHHLYYQHILEEKKYKEEVNKLNYMSDEEIITQGEELLKRFSGKSE